MDKEKLGERLKKVRKDKGLTQEELGEISDIGYKYISRIETGNADISLNNFVKLVNALETPPDILLQDSLKPGIYLNEAKRKEHLTYQECGEEKTERLLFMLDAMLTLIGSGENGENSNM